MKRRTSGAKKPQRRASAVAAVRPALREEDAVEQNKAISDILRVITSSPGNLQPVFATILSHAMRLCGAKFGNVFRYDGAVVEMVASNLPPASMEIMRRDYPAPPSRGKASGRVVLDRKIVEIPDIHEDPEYKGTAPRASGYRALFGVPLLREGRAIGAIVIARTEPGRFAPHQVAMVQAFADQAVIAIENVRLFNETKEALERQTATSEILRVITTSPTDVRPVMAAIVENAARLANAEHALIGQTEGGNIRWLAAHGCPLPTSVRSITRSLPSGRAMLDLQTTQVRDIGEIEVDESVARAYRELGVRTIMATPLVREGRPIGVLLLRRTQVRPFDERQVALLKIFADQASIALENVRLFNDTKEALERQTVTADILSVIAASPADVQPVFDTIAENALKLCGASFSLVSRFDGELIHVAATRNLDPKADEKIRRAFPARPSQRGVTSRCILNREVIHVPDITQDPQYSPSGAAETAKIRSILAVPMLRRGEAVGAIAVSRTQTGMFPEHRVRLLKTFADQAVIAIENVRLFNETKEALERQTATSEILRVISSSPNNVQPVFDAIVASGMHLFPGAAVAVSRPDGDQVRLAAIASSDAEQAARWGEAFPFPLVRERIHGMAILDNRLVDFPDVGLADEVSDDGKKAFLSTGNRAITVIPMLRENRAIGAISVIRRAAGPLTDKQIALLKTFADQAAIAIENVRLFNETKEALEQQTATSDVLDVISRSTLDATPVFQAVVDKAVALCGADNASILQRDGDVYRYVANAGRFADQESFMSYWETITLRPGRGSLTGRVALERRSVQIEDIDTDPEYERDYAAHKVSGSKAHLGVPLLKDGEPVGLIIARRFDARPFTDKQVRLLETFAAQAVIAIENVRLFSELQTSNRELTRALDKQTATSDILRVISRSQTDVQPVFDAIVHSAVRLLRGYSGALSRVSGDEIVLAANTRTDEAGNAATKALFPQPLASEFPHAQAIRAGAPLNVADARTDSRLLDDARAYAEVRGYRSWIVVPMLRHNEAIGAIGVTRREAGGFTDDEIALLRTFADQAVIAIENVRLFNETKEALEKQTATADILQVLSGSPSDTQPVFDAIVRHAARLCDSAYANVFRYDGERLHLAASEGVPADVLESLKRASPMAPGPSRVVGRVILSRRPVRVEDTHSDPQYDREYAGTLRLRRILGVPLLRAERSLGVITIGWAEPGPILPRHEDLLKTFADQAVIAIENVRLFNETREALQRQTATADILRAISGSPTDTQPVFDAIVASALKLFDGHGVGILLADGERIQMGSAGGILDMAEARARYPVPLNGESVSGRAMVERTVVNIGDTEAPGVPQLARELGRALGYRSICAAPMMREGSAIGAIAVVRKAAEPLPENDVALLRTFADQAVIAIENARLFNETREALEQQTATAGVLQVISRSTFDLDSVFKALVENAVRLCGAQTGMIFRREGASIRLDAAYGASEQFVQYVGEHGIALDRGSVTGRAALDGRTVHVLDVTADPDYNYGGRPLEAYRTIVGVPLKRDGETIGVFTIWRHQVEAFTPRQIALFETFADQAVIAIENVRLFNETKEALERQTATAEILKAISGSTTDTQPVFDAIVESGCRLFPGATVIVALRDGEQVRLAAVAGPNASSVRHRFPFPLSKEYMHGLAILDRALVDIPDAQAYTEGPLMPGIRNFLQSGNRAQTVTPMMKGDTAIGAVSVTHEGPVKLSDKQLALLRTFADQAVIAIENVRLFKELQSRTDALTRSVSQLTALGDVGRAIGSTLDLDTVLKTIVSHAVKLTGLEAGTIYEYDEATEQFRLRAAERMSDEVAEILRSEPIRRGEGAVGRTAVTREPVQVSDIRTEHYDSRLRDILLRAGRRAVLAVPLLHEDRIIGALGVQKDAAGPFAPPVVELLKTFATQSAMAIQNARLYREIEQKSRELEAASKHKSHFLASMSHELRTPLNAILGFNEMILDGIYGELTPDVRAPLENIQSSGKHLLRLINNVLDLAKIEAGRMELALSDYSVQDTVASVHSTLKPLAAEKGLEFVADVPADIPPAHGDAGRLAQCLMNLAGNSLKFTKEGRVSIAVAQGNGLLRFSVADTGIGIPAEKIPALFTEFKQTDATIASEYGGTGLGLSITKKFIEMHGGRIWVESEAGKGSTFLFEIPLRAAS